MGGEVAKAMLSFRTMNRVLLTGRLTRDPEMRSLAPGKNVTTFSSAVVRRATQPRRVLYPPTRGPHRSRRYTPSPDD